MLAVDEDVGHGALVRDLLEGVLDGGAVLYTRSNTGVRSDQSTLSDVRRKWGGRGCNEPT